MADKTRVSEGKIRLLKQSNEFLFPVELWLLNDGVNRNGWRYENIRENMRKFLGTPVLVAYINGGRTIGDGHNFDSETDAEGNQFVVNVAVVLVILGMLNVTAQVLPFTDVTGALLHPYPLEVLVNIWSVVHPLGTSFTVTAHV